MNTNKGSIVKQSGNDVEGCRSEKVLVQPNMRVFLQYSVRSLVTHLKGGLPHLMPIKVSSHLIVKTIIEISKTKTEPVLVSCVMK